MTFDRQEIEALAPYENYFRTAVRSSYASYPGLQALRFIHETYCNATGSTRSLNTACSTCVLNLLRDCGKIYFADKDALAKADEEIAAKRVALDQAAAEKKTAVEVKTTKSGRIRAMKPKTAPTPAEPKHAAPRRNKATKN